MYVDKNLLFSENQNVAAGLSQNVLDFGTKGDANPNAFLVVNLEKELTALQGLTVEVQTAKDEAFTIIEVVGSFNAKKGVKGAIRQRLPMGLNRFVRLNYAVVGAPAGKMTAIVACDADMGMSA